MWSTETGKSLAGEQIEQFKEDGFVFLPGFLDDETIGRLREEADRIMELAINSSLANDRKSQRLSLNDHNNGNQSVRNVQPFIDISLPFKRLAVDIIPPLLRPLMEDDPVSLDRLSQLNYKQSLPDPIPELNGAPFSGDYPVHADWPYFEGKAATPTDFVIGSVFIDECTEANGALEIWPGTHEQTFDHETTDLGAFSVPQDQVDYDGGQTICGSAGSILFFDAKLVHSSGVNSTSGPRRIAIYRHGPANNVETTIHGGSARPKGYGFPREIIETTFEHEYRRLKRNQEFEDRFSAPGA